MDWLRSLGASIGRGVEELGSELVHGAQRLTQSVNFVEPFERAAQGARDLYVGAEKWFTGTSGEPDPSLTGLSPEYRRVDGPLFVRGEGDACDIDPNDIDQGKAGDCYLMAGLAAVARTNPEAIRRMIRDNGDGTYTVTLHVRRLPWESGGEFKKVEVTVSNALPFQGESLAFARPGDGNELWVALIEKAYASYYGRYAHIEHGFPGHAMEVITGVPSRVLPPPMLTLEELARYDRAGYALAVSTAQDFQIGPFDIPDITDRDPLFTSGALAPGHVYFIESVDPEAGTLTIRNPWGPGYSPIVLTEDQFHRLFTDVALNPTR